MNEMVKHLKTWGLKVETKDGFEHRGRPYSFNPRAVICHHTASSSTSGNYGSEGIVTSGRSDLPGPLCQFLLGRDGTVKIIALGYANHAGYGGPRSGIPENLGNSYTYGIEAENNGIGEKWSKEQANAYYRLCAALLNKMGTKDVSKVFAHKEWTSRKIDPAGLNMDQFRENVKKALNEGPSVRLVSIQKLRKGKRNSDVLALKTRLSRRGFYDGKDFDNYFGKHLVTAVEKYQEHHSLEVTGNPEWQMLRKLGFKVKK